MLLISRYIDRRLRNHLPSKSGHGVLCVRERSAKESLHSLQVLLGHARDGRCDPIDEDLAIIILLRKPQAVSESSATRCACEQGHATRASKNDSRVGVDRS